MGEKMKSAMARYEIEQELDRLYRDLDLAYNSDEETACLLFNVDEKREAIQAITDEIDCYEGWLKEMGEEEHYDLWDDHGFACEADYVNWRYGA